MEGFGIRKWFGVKDIVKAISNEFTLCGLSLCVDGLSSDKVCQDFFQPEEAEYWANSDANS